MSRIFTLVLAIFVLATPARALDPAALREVVAMAKDICGEYQLEGNRSELELKGQAEAKVSGLLDRLVDLGVDGAATLDKQEYSNVVHEKLAEEIASNRTCRQDMTRFLTEKLEAALPSQSSTVITPTPGNGQGAGQTASAGVITPVVPTTFDLSGLWQYRGNCPATGLYFEGTFEMYPVGGGQYQGTIATSLGYFGQFSANQQGSNVATTIQWADFTLSYSQGVVTPDGYAMDIQDSAGCLSRAFRVN